MPFLGCKAFIHCQHLSCSLVHLSKFINCPFQEWPRVFYNGDSRGINTFDDISLAMLGFVKFSRRPFSFISASLMMSTFILIKNLYFFSSVRSEFFLSWQFYSFRYLSVSTFHFEYGTFFCSKFHSYILTIHSYCLN